MNNSLYRVVKMLQERLEGMKKVHTVVYARTEEKDLYKNAKYPLVHINPTVSPYQNHQTSAFTFEIGAFNQRIDGEDRDKFSDNNVIDNHNTTYAILNELLTDLEKNLNYELYEVSEVSPLRPIYLSDSNGLDGWVVLITITVNNTLDLC